MRVLLAVLSPVTRELGAAQMALNLSSALRAQGIDAVVWTPHPMPKDVPGWRHMAWMRRKLADYVTADGRFDVVDVSAVGVTRRLVRQCAVVTRNAQPELAYLWTEVRFVRRASPVTRLEWAGRVVFSAYLGALVLCGWARGRRILCLGSAEFEWMSRWFPWWRKKLVVYVNAIGDDEREILEQIRRERRPPRAGAVRFLWLGRWAAHKGVDRLLDFVRERLARRPDDSVTIAGCGPGVERYLPPALRETGRIRVVPWYDRPGLMDLLRSHDAGLFTSRIEGWGLTLQEMLESGMPVYATEAGAVTVLQAEFPDLLREFPPSTSEDVTTTNPSRARPQYFERFSWRAIARGYVSVIQKTP